MLEMGQTTSILVQRDGERFVLVHGLHRLEECKALGEESSFQLSQVVPQAYSAAFQSQFKLDVIMN